MVQVVAAGTASHLRVDAQGKLLPPELQFAGKTGTAQVKRITERERDMGITQASLPWHLRHHALFVCFAPVDAPRYACAVIVEHGGGGSRVAAPIARDVMRLVQARDGDTRLTRDFHINWPREAKVRVLDNSVTRRERGDPFQHRRPLDPQRLREPEKLSDDASVIEDSDRQV